MSNDGPGSVYSEDEERVKQKASKVAHKGFSFLADKLGIKKIKRAVIIAIALFFLLFIVVLLPLAPFIAVYFGARGLFEKAAGLCDKFLPSYGIQYDTEKEMAWNSEDPEQTFVMYSCLYEAFNDEQLNPDSEPLSEETKEQLKDLMRQETLYVGPQDILDLLEKSYSYNRKMFQINKHAYEYHQYELQKKTGPGPYYKFEGWSWEESTPSDNTNDDGIYDILTYENTRGELLDGERIYAVRWPEVIALGIMWSQGKEEDWGTSDESKYVYNEGSPYEDNDVDGYYFTDSELLSLFKLFSYNFEYYWDGVEDTSHQVMPYEWDKLKIGDYSISYRYSRIADPENLHEPAPQVLTNEEAPDYDGENPTPTKFVPDSSPNEFCNSWDKNKYVYVSTSDVPDYTPDIENYEPPSGMYCIGKWQIIDPRDFINTMAMMYPYYRQNAFDNPVLVEQYDYKWPIEMMERYTYYLDLLESTLGGVSRSDYYMHLAELYVNETIEVKYYGMRLDAETENTFIEAIRANNPGMNVEVDFSNAVDYGEWFEVNESDPKLQTSNGTVPFPSYGVTYRGTSSNDYDIQNGNTDINYTYEGEIFVSSHGSKVFNGYIHLLEGADEDLTQGYSYTLDEIRAMCAILDRNVSTMATPETGGKRFTFSACAEDLWEFNRQTGYDIAALLAIILTENTPDIGNYTWNWFNYTPFGSEISAGWWYKRPSDKERIWYSPYKRYSQGYAGYHSLEGCCLVTTMRKITENYWKKRQQVSYFKMQFNRYGWSPGESPHYPDNLENALEEERNMDNAGYCYCPWWDDTGFLTTHYNYEYLWCNKNAKNRALLRAVARKA